MGCDARPARKTSGGSREGESSSPEDASEHLGDARRRSKALWGTMAPGWHERREGLRHRSRPVGEWMVRKLDPQPGDTVLELAGALADNGFMAAPLVGETARVIVADFAPEMVGAARRRAEEVGLKNARFGVLYAGRVDLEVESVDGVLCRWAAC